MTLTESTMPALGSKASDFLLPDTRGGDKLSYAQVAGERGTVILFICNHCPYVIHVRDELLRIGRAYLPRGIGFAAVSSNDVSTHPEDGPEAMAKLAKAEDFPFPYLYDETQDMARAYRAACTPDIFVFNAERALVYRGRLDASTPGNGVPVTGADLRAALDALLQGKRLDVSQQHPSMGCNIKWAR